VLDQKFTESGLKPMTAGEEAALEAALEEANVPTLLLCLAHLTGDRRWVSPPYVPGPARGPSDNDTGGFSDDVQAEIRGSALKILRAWREGRVTPSPDPSPDDIREMLEISLAEEMPAGSGEMLAEELGTQSRRVAMPPQVRTSELSVAVIGAGISGLLAAIELQAAGITFTVLEKDETVGGTWFENTYPGCGVDTPVHLYSLSFAQRSTWERYFAKQPDLFRYLRELADEYDVEQHIRFGLEVTDASWDEPAQRWKIFARDRDGVEHLVEANIIITGVGYFNRPATPRLPGLDTFEGPVMHTARWQEEVVISGRRVGVIGTGASAMQLVPNIAGTAERVSIFQRSPQWGIPHPNYMRTVSPATQLLMREVPHYLGWYRLRLVWGFGDRLIEHVQLDPAWPHQERSINEANDRQRRFLTRYIESELGERTDLLSKCVPDYPPYGKRPLLDNGWFRTVARDDVDLITDPIAEIRPDCIVTNDGSEFPIDVIVLATGFNALQVLAPMRIVGRSGRTLRETWGEDDARAHLGITVPDFPNLFCLLGPNTFAGHGGSGILTIELEMRYVMETIRAMIERQLSSVECRQEVYDAYNEDLDEALNRTIWAHPGMTTYYRNSQGRIVVPMPWTNADYWKRTRHPNLDEFILGHR
jgi:4-hydroxyacetophenone monooxygenase